jgi:hypothetical protein
LRLYVGLSKQIELPEGGFLFIGDEARKAKGSRVFDPKKDSFNPLAQLDYRSASDFVDIIDSIFSRDENTLTKDTGLDFLPSASIEAQIAWAAHTAAGERRYDGSYMGAREDWTHTALAGLAARVVQTEDKRPQSPASRKEIFARLNRAELGDFDARVLGPFLMANFKGQIVVEDLGFYGRDILWGRPWHWPRMRPLARRRSEELSLRNHI